MPFSELKARLPQQTKQLNAELQSPILLLAFRSRACVESHACSKRLEYRS